jgi:4-cresol dehydrogenase (hydroxylating)
VIGNACDRGVGFERQRTEDVVGLEVVLADGSVVRVGSFWQWGDACPDGSPSAFHYRHGLGPDLMPLFLQGNLGVVTAAVVNLVPRPERTLLVSGQFAHSQFAGAVDAIRSLYHDGTMGSVAKIYDVSALRNYGLRTIEAGEEGSFQLLGSITGTKAVAGARAAAVRARLAPWFRDGTLTVQSREDLVAPEVPEASRVALGRFTGRPTCAGHEETFGPGCDLDTIVPGGWLFFLPVVPFTAADLERAARMLAEVAAETGTSIGSTMNVIHRRCVDLVVSLHFDPGVAPRERAHTALQRLHDRFRAHGYYSYREDLDHQHLTGPAAYQRTVAVLKRALDPLGIIAPGRYESPATAAAAAAGSSEALDRVVPRTIDEVRERAKARLHPLVYRYMEYRANDGVATRGRVDTATRDAFDALRLRTRVLRSVASVSTETTLLGTRVRTPVVVAPTAFHCILHPSGELGTARGAEDVGAL